MWAPAKIQLLTPIVDFHGLIDWFFRQTTWAYNEIIGFLKQGFRIFLKHGGTSIATERIFFSFVFPRFRSLLGNTQSHKGTATCRANRRFHFDSSLFDFPMYKLQVHLLPDFKALHRAPLFLEVLRGGFVLHILPRLSKFFLLENQPAQHESRETSRLKVWAQSLIPSTMVR